MKLLIITQVVDTQDPVLGFFHEWIAALASRYESMEVICLREGTHALPANVCVHSLGKESGASRLKYVTRLFTYAWTLRRGYDAVFVHMNQEYLLLAGWLWKLLGKRMYMWRNFHTGSFLTDLAAFWCTRVFCTSASSYTAKYKKTELMPVGIDTERFTFGGRERIPNSILSIGRIAPEKRLELLVDAAKSVAAEMSLRVDLYGDALPKDHSYYASLKSQAVANHEVAFHGSIPNSETPHLYQTHEVFVNLSYSGMYDKTIFEAAACGCLVIATSDDWKKSVDPRLSCEPTEVSLASAITTVVQLSNTEKAELREQLRAFVVENHSLSVLGERLAATIY